LDSLLEDPAVRRPGADAQGIVGLDDPVEAVDVADVDEQARLGEPQLQQWQEAVTARQDLRIALALGQDPQRVVETGRSDVVELTRDHPSSSASGTRTLTLVADAAGTFAGRLLPAIRPGRTEGFRRVRGVREWR
jgi:hypothetical protein